jgi:hypothetical protein
MQRSLAQLGIYARNADSISSMYSSPLAITSIDA